jgi:hypothetical protein
MGHMIYLGGLRVEKKKVEVISQLPQSSNVNQLLLEVC